ncbi:hypothetical protein EOA86_19075, partial [Mesorhizobium sp. M5C.F.Ca.IN.020.32.2.1]
MTSPPGEEGIGDRLGSSEHAGFLRLASKPLCPRKVPLRGDHFSSRKSCSEARRRSSCHAGAGDPPKNEGDHFYICPICAQPVDMRDLRQVIWHDKPVHDRLEMD